MTTTLMPTILWTQPGCGPCIAAARMLDAAGVHYVKMDASLADSWRVSMWRGKRWSTPIIEAGALFFQGADPDRIAALAEV